VTSRAERFAARWPRLGAWLGRGSGAPVAGDALLVALLALVVRVPLVAYAAERFPPADDGSFYQVVAGRIAEGLGYTWLWPDGAVTYAAHYPVGYPALIGAGYALFGPEPGVAMAINALFGVLGAVAAHALAASVAARGGALLAGALAALVPGLLLYTPALMTEAVAADLLILAAAVAAGPRPRPLFARALLAGAALGLALLVRPQLLLVAPAFGALIGFRERDRGFRWRGALIVSAVALAVCLPWTARNCQRLDGCAFVSANGGWNLFIGSSPLGRGGFAPIDRIGVPEECRTVFGEAGKDRCFGRAGARAIAERPLSWLALVPLKLGMTFDYGTASAHYLSASNPTLVGESEKIGIGALELLGQRLLLLAALLAAARAPGPRSRARRLVAVLSAFCALTPAGFLGWMGLLLVLGLLGRTLLRHPPALVAGASVLATALIHAVFFGASRYALVCLPPLAALAGALWPARDLLDTSEPGAGY
jgi:4-amino-4-deoxy-L-arabinose transferase-like glycosyltransferase